MHHILATVLLTSLAAAQSAVFAPFGNGCAFDNQTLSIGSQGLPQLGTTMRITYSGPNYTHNFAQQIAWPQLGLGFNQGVTPIPSTILPMQPVGCNGLILPDVMLAAPVHPTLPEYDAVDFSVPSDPAFIGVTLYAQWLMVHTQCGFAGCGMDAIATSDAALMVLGT